MITLNTNLGSMIVQSNLTSSTNALNTAIERMTTGFKINHAKDNAANYSISTNLASKLSSYSVAQDNVAMGLDMLTTAEDSLSLISDHLSRIRDLTEQAANGTYGQDSLNAIQSEITARLAECDRIVSNTEYNGIKLFGEGGSSTTGGGGEFIQQIDPLTEEEAIQQGYTIIKTADDLKSINNDMGGKYILMSNIDLFGEDWTPLGYDPVNPPTAFSGEFNGNGYVINNLTIKEPSGSRIGLFSFVRGGNVLNLGLENVNVNGYAYTGGIAGMFIGNLTNCYVTGDIHGRTIAGGLATAFAGSATDCYVLSDVSADDNYVGALFAGLFDSSTSINNCCIKPGAIAVAQKIGSVDLSNIIEGTPPIADNNITDTSIFIQFQAGIHSDSSSQINLDLSFGYSGLTIDVSTSDAARNSLNQIDEMLSKIRSKQTEYGAAYNRLESALESIGVSIDNLTSTQSTIRDADIAEVSSEYIQMQILQQASATLLATANQTPSIALQLL